MKTRTWIIIFAAAVLVCIGVYFLVPHAAGRAIGIYKDGKEIRVIDASDLAGEYEIVIEEGGERNVVLVSEGTVRMKEANCPDGTCVEHGPLESSAAPIVCLPNKVIVKYVEAKDGGVDAVSGVAG